MELVIGNGVLTVKRGDSPKIYSESALYHAIKKELQRQGYDVIKKLMWKDGHLYGSENTHYIRGRKWRKVDGKLDAVMIYDGHYALRFLYEDYNKEGETELMIDGDLNTARFVHKQQ